VNVNPYIGLPEIARGVRHLFDSPREVQIDEPWSYVGHKGEPRWLWSAIDATTGCVLSYVFGRRNDEICAQLLENLQVFNIRTFYTDDWSSYSALISKDKHVIGKRYTQKIENRFLLLRTRVKRLTRKTICFSKSETFHDTVIGLFINRYCFEPL
jgi:insertion element IS1 protein InsB